MMFRIMEDDRDDRTLLISIYDGMLMELRHRNPQNFGIANIIVKSKGQFLTTNGT